MEHSTLVFLLALVGACYGSSIPCPEACRCTRNIISGTIARCTELDPDVQRFPPEISHLVVENYIGDRDMALTDMMFVDMGLDHVRTIRIINSTLRDIRLSAFHGLHNLQEVDFSHNRLILIHPDTFQNNKRLTRLRLKGNPLQLTQVLEQKDHHFLNSDSLRELDLSDCRLTQIAPKTFSNLRGLELLDLSGNDLTEITADALANLESLEDLYLSDNSISKIHPDAFNDIDDLVVLSLRGNPIKTLEGIEIIGLVELDASQCDLEILAAASLEGFPELETLNLSRNAIKDIDPDTFISVPTLKYLDLSYNMIRSPLDKALLTLNRKLETLSLAGNRDFKVFEELFGTFPRLYHLDLSDCGLTNINTSAFQNLQRLVRLNISNNDLQHIPLGSFDSLKYLTVLDLSSNRLHYLNNDLFAENKKLQKLYLSNNLFRHVPAILFQNTLNLEWLDLSNCRLVALWNITEAIILKDKKIFSNLRYLNVSGNKLIKLHRHSFISMRKLEKLDISNNPIQCTSDFSHVMQWLIVNKVMPNKGTGSRPENLDFIDNNIEWDEVLKVVCPIIVPNYPPIINTLPIEEPQKTFKHATLFKNTEKRYNASKNSPPIIIEEPISLQGPEEITKLEPISEQPLVWPMIIIWISILLIFIALGNLVGLLIYRSRRQYRVLSFKPQFSNPIDHHFPVRRGGGRSPYQKLYEECSVPTPVHDKKINIVTILGTAFQKNNSKV